MGIVRVTTRPHLYAQEAVLPEEYVSCDSEGSGWMQLSFEVEKGRESPILTQKKLKELISEVLGCRARYYQRSNQRMSRYEIGGWAVCSKKVNSPSFTFDRIDQILRVIEVLGQNGYKPTDGIMIDYAPGQMEIRTVMNLCAIVEARSSLIKKALELEEEIRVHVDQTTIAFVVMVPVFSIRKIEACVFLLHQAAIQAMAIGKVRMKPTDESNPKYQMRTWLLRLGFIGEQFERPRKTLMEGLQGDGAFYDAAGKERAQRKKLRERAMRWGEEYEKKRAQRQ